MTESCKHSANLSVPPFVNHQQQLRFFIMRTQYAHARRCGEPVVKLNSAFEGATFTAAEFTGAEHAVGFVRAVSRVHKPIGCFAVVGNKNQSFGVIIQSADRVQSVRQFAEKSR